MKWTILVAVALIVYKVVASSQGDLAKFRGWRARIAHWHTTGLTPPVEHQRDTLLWRLRLAGLALTALAIGTMLVAIELAPPNNALFLVLALLAFFGASVWGTLSSRVR